MSEPNQHDIVLFGATGFTGKLTADYLARNLPAGASWALAGRNRQKLEAVRDSLPAGAAEAPELLQADVTDAPSLRTVAEQARVVITTVGPYIHYGDPLVKACAETGTDYVDLTGEPEFVDRSYVRHHATAVKSGARLVHACGFDSIPYDLGVYFTVQQLPEDVPLKVEGFVRAGGGPSGGTYQSALAAMGRLRGAGKEAKARRKAEPAGDGRRVHGLAGPPRKEPRINGWAVSLPTIDPQIVLRSARALPRYGPDFTYGHYAAIKRLATIGIGGVALGGMVVGAQLPPTRKLLEKLKSSGDGPSAEQREKSWFSVRLFGEGGGQKVQCEVKGGDPGYGETAKMLSESALCLAFDDGLPEVAGQVTTAQAMAEPLLARLQAAGITFAVR